MKKLNIAYIVAGVVLGYAIYEKTHNLVTSIVIGFVVATLGRKAGRIVKSRKKSN